ncbi:MAG: hypothetical protein LKJ13_01795 [Clostridia bacterium]|nr:hypothetical protein [Clostridia bacterium]MCI1999011.1 hypothetical protein [Clostridia bacterium]MCI2013761.1 hypothetical protein [Clostridia bacterium]
MSNQEKDIFRSVYNFFAKYNHKLNDDEWPAFVTDMQAVNEEHNCYLCARLLGVIFCYIEKKNYDR